MVGAMLDYGCHNFGLWLAQFWLIKAGEHNVGFWLAQCWVMVGKILFYG